MNLHIQLVFLLGLLTQLICNAQEGEIQVEESAEVFLEEYSDEFEETFFEALKQKGIENYDRAINLLLKCKDLDANNQVVDAELAKAYLASKQYISAQEYALNALNAAPENIWYLQTLMDVLQKQGNTIENVKSKIIYDNSKLKENLAFIYFKQQSYTKALNILKGIKKSDFTEELTIKIQDSIAQTSEPEPENEDEVVVKEENPVIEIRTRIDDFLNKKDFSGAEKISLEAMESFPSQPYFYYVNGLALNNKGKYKEAIEVLEIALDYLLDDENLENKIYLELANSHNAIGNTSKANNYLSKIKPGS